jgi:hypothetical protein
LRCAGRSALAAWSALDLSGCPTEARSEFVGDDVDGGALVSLAGGVLTLLESAGDDDASALRQRRCSVLAKLAPRGDVEVRSLLLPFAVDLITTTDGDAEG